MITKEDVFTAIADAWWERKPKIVEFVRRVLSPCFTLGARLVCCVDVSFMLVLTSAHNGHR